MQFSLLHIKTEGDDKITLFHSVQLCLPTVAPDLQFQMGDSA
jgi:hypothetical protein